MIISEKQIAALMETARILSLDESYSQGLREKLSDLIFEINDQQSEELKEVK